MAYKLSKLGEDVLRDVKVFCERYVSEQGRAADRGSKLPLDIYAGMAEMGLGTLFVVAEAGGPALTYQDKAAILEEVGRCDAGIAVALMTTALTRYVVDRYGSEEQKEKCLSILEQGKMGAFCLTESGAGSDISRIKATARATEDGYILDGSKAFVTNAEVAGYFIVFARLEEDMAAFFVSMGENITIGAEEGKLGVKNSSTAEVSFNGVAIGKDGLLGSKADGKTIALESLDFARIWCAAVATGIAQAALELAISYAKEREQFGGPISDNQVIQAKIADMYMKTTAARAVVRNAIEELETLETQDTAEVSADVHKVEMARSALTVAASTAKTTASDAAVHCALEAVQVLGGYGYCNDYPAEKLLRDAKVFQIFEGTNEIQRMIVGRQLLK